MPAGKTPYTLILCVFLFPASLFADMVYLKNGSAFEGVIEREGPAGLTLHLGYGKISFEKKDIASVRRYTLDGQNELVKSWNYKYFSRPESIPEELRDLATDFDNLENLHERGTRARKELDKGKKESQRLEKDLQELHKDLADVSEQLNAARPKEDVEKYNSQVDAFNSLAARIRIADYKKSELKKSETALEGNISDFINEFGLFRNRFLKRLSASKAQGKEENAYFFEGVNKELNQMDNDFIKHAVDFDREGLNIIVDVMLNGIIKTPLMVDTGASVVVISKNLAERLGLKTELNPPLMMTLADGRKVPATPVVLESIKIGDVEVRNVKAAVIETNEVREEYGLLGMSFLENFVVRIDAKANRLIFEEFQPGS
jgi:clan AA aspartic protease (TIGR02281 family)